MMYFGMSLPKAAAILSGVLSLSILPERALAQSAGIESQMLDALQAYCIQTAGQPEAAIAAASRDGWVPSRGRGSQNAQFMMRRGPDSLILALDSPPGMPRGGKRFCIIQSQRGDADVAVVELQARIAGSEEMEPRSENGQRAFIYRESQDGLQPVGNAASDAAFGELLATGQYVSLVIRGAAPNFEVGLAYPRTQ